MNAFVSNWVAVKTGEIIAILGLKSLLLAFGWFVLILGNNARGVRL